MGTANYMSPEQARGEVVDVRTDIWSLGVVLYELVAGCAPFERSTPSEVIALILEREPPPLARYAREVPPELERIVGKALTKDRGQRYQTAKDLLVDLRRLRQRLEVEAETERSACQKPLPNQQCRGPPTEVITNESTAYCCRVAHPTSVLSIWLRIKAQRGDFSCAGHYCGSSHRVWTVQVHCSKESRRQANRSPPKNEGHKAHQHWPSHLCSNLARR